LCIKVADNVGKTNAGENRDTIPAAITVSSDFVAQGLDSGGREGGGGALEFLDGYHVWLVLLEPSDNSVNPSPH
jgi:hypothetical protein